MNMILWNTSKHKFSGQYDSKFHHFAPDEKKIFSFNTDWDKALANHLLFQLECFGLVEISEKATGEDIKKAYTKGVKARWRQMDSLCRNFRTMNKEREAAKMSADLPSDIVVEAASEAKQLLAEIKTLEADKFAAVDSYLNDDTTKKTQDMLDDTEHRVEVSPLATEVTSGRRKGR